jgi:signal transduction histidine kinase
MMHAGAIGYPLVEGFRSRIVTTEGQRREQALASVRLVLAIGLAVYLLVVAQPAYAQFTYRSVLAYVVYSLLLLVLVRTKQDLGLAGRLCVHAVDALCAALILWSGGSAASGLLLENVFLIFVLLAAAYRWGLRGTLATSAVWILFPLAPQAFAALGLTGLGPQHLWPLPPEESQRFVIHALTLLVTAAVLGYLGERETDLRANTSLISGVMAKARSEAGLRETVQAVMDALLDLFNADRAVLAVRQPGSGRAFLWEAERERGTHKTVVQLSELESFQKERYFFPVPGRTFYASRRSMPRQRDQRFQLLVRDAESDRLVNASCSFPDYFLTWHPFSSLLAAAHTSGERDEWSSRLFLFDPRIGDRGAKVRLLHDLAEELAPAVYAAYRLRRLRSRAVSMERARIARELHDGVIQTLIGVEMEIAAAHRQASGDPALIADELRSIHGRLRQEILNVRDLVQRMKPLEMDGRQFPDCLALVVDKFRRDTGICARFVSDVRQIGLPRHLMYELTRILQEALVNVRKHSHARSVLVRFAAEDGLWKLMIEDDGRGFEFSGRLSQAELETARSPLVLKERVRSIGGELAIESIPGHGARLEVALPQEAHGYEEVYGQKC